MSCELKNCTFPGNPSENVRDMLSGVFSKLLWLLRVFYSAIDRFYWDNGFSKAASLAYTSLLSLVPLLALGFGILASFAISGQYVPGVREFIFKQFVPNNQAVDAVLGYIGEFSEAISSLNAVVIGALVVTSLLLINSIEYVLNETWQVFEPRPIAHRIAIFSSILLIGPVLILSSYYFIKFRLEPFLMEVPFGGYLTTMYHTVLPFVIDFAAFSCLYYLVPHAPVKVRSALFGAFWGALLFNFAKSGFAMYLEDFPSYDRIYKTLSAIPISLFWLYLAWTIVLFGAELCYQAQHLPKKGRAWKRSLLSVGDGQLLLAFQAVIAISRSFTKGGRLPNELELAESLGCSGVVLKPTLDRMERAGIVIRGDSHDRPLSLGKSPEAVKLADVKEALITGAEQVRFSKELGQVFKTFGCNESCSLAEVLKASSDE